MKAFRKSGDNITLIFNLDIRWIDFSCSRDGCFTPKEWVPSIHLTEDWVDPYGRFGEDKIVAALTGKELRLIRLQVHNIVTILTSLTLFLSPTEAKIISFSLSIWIYYYMLIYGRVLCYCKCLNCLTELRLLRAQYLNILNRDRSLDCWIVERLLIFKLNLKQGCFNVWCPAVNSCVESC
jgi:hypothetical protein